MGSDLNFSGALELLLQGKRLARHGWNGSGMYVYFVPAAHYPAQTEIAKKEFGETVPYAAYIAMKTRQGYVVCWTASQTDLLSDDWYIVE